MDGKQYTLSGLKGKVVVMNFWFTKCKPYVDEMPGLNKIVEKFENNKNLIFLAFSWNKKIDIGSFLKKRSFLYNIIPESMKIVFKLWDAFVSNKFDTESRWRCSL